MRKRRLNENGAHSTRSELHPCAILLLMSSVRRSLKSLNAKPERERKRVEVTRKRSYGKDDRAMCPIYECPENFRESLTMPKATFREI